jgi:tRNA-Thr(GGU) m(6)t(6)A37 methyltransferase TsaA
MDERILRPVAHIYNDYKEKFGIPRQSGRANSVRSKIIFEKEYRHPEALRGIDGFSHLWLLFDFSKAHKDEFSPTVRPPRLGGNTKVGVFASRSPFRPNSIGLSVVKLEKVEKTSEGTILIVSGADLLNGTPIYDVKPYLPYADCIENAKGGYTESTPWQSLEVEFKEGVKEKIVPEKLQGLIEVLQEDPRPSYQDDERIYKMKFGEYDISFQVEEQILTVLEVNRDS